MSRRINCTLTDAQWDHLWSAVAYYECHLQDNVDGGEAGPWGTALAVVGRLSSRLSGVSV